MQAVMSPTDIVQESTNAELRKNGTTFSNLLVDHLISEVEGGSLTVVELKAKIQQTSEKFKKMNLKWSDKEKPNEHGTISTLASNNETIAYIQEKINSITLEKFYALKEIKRKGEEINHINLFTRNELAECKDIFYKFLTARAYKQVEKELKTQKKEIQLDQEKGIDIN